jgi:hypothetical protein
MKKSKPDRQAGGWLMDAIRSQVAFAVGFVAILSDPAHPRVTRVSVQVIDS